MQTDLNITISTREEAKAYLLELFNNDEAYHPEDPASEIVWDDVEPTTEEIGKLDSLMDQCYELEGFNPCEYLNGLSEVAAKIEAEL